MILDGLAFNFVPGIEKRRDCALKFEAQMFGVVLCAVRTHSMQRLDARVGLELQRLVEVVGNQRKTQSMGESFTGNPCEDKEKSSCLSFSFSALASLKAFRSALISSCIVSKFSLERLSIVTPCLIARYRRGVIFSPWLELHAILSRFR